MPEVLAVTAATLACTIGGPLALLAAARAAGQRIRTTADHHTVGDHLPPTPPLIAAGPGALSEEERAEQAWAATTTAADIDRLNHITHATTMRVHMRVERALRQILHDEPDDWTRVHSGEYALVGAG